MCGLSGNVRIGQLSLVPPVTNASFSRNKSPIDEILSGVSSATCPDKRKQRST